MPQYGRRSTPWSWDVPEEDVPERISWAEVEEQMRRAPKTPPPTFDMGAPSEGQFGDFPEALTAPSSQATWDVGLPQGIPPPIPTQPPPTFNLGLTSGGPSGWDLVSQQQAATAQRPWSAFEENYPSEAGIPPAIPTAVPYTPFEENYPWAAAPAAAEPPAAAPPPGRLEGLPQWAEGPRQYGLGTMGPIAPAAAPAAPAAAPPAAVPAAAPAAVAAQAPTGGVPGFLKEAGYWLLGLSPERRARATALQAQALAYGEKAAAERAKAAQQAEFQRRAAGLPSDIFRTEVPGAPVPPEVSQAYREVMETPELAMTPGYAPPAEPQPGPPTVRAAAAGEILDRISSIAGPEFARQWAGSEEGARVLNALTQGEQAITARMGQVTARRAEERQLAQAGMPKEYHNPLTGQIIRSYPPPPFGNGGYEVKDVGMPTETYKDQEAVNSAYATGRMKKETYDQITQANREWQRFKTDEEIRKEQETAALKPKAPMQAPSNPAEGMLWVQRGDMTPSHFTTWHTGYMKDQADKLQQEITKLEKAGNIAAANELKKAHANPERLRPSRPGVPPATPSTTKEVAGRDYIELGEGDRKYYDTADMVLRKSAALQAIYDQAKGRRFVGPVEYRKWQGYRASPIAMATPEDIKLFTDLETEVNQLKRIAIRPEAGAAIGPVERILFFPTVVGMEMYDQQFESVLSGMRRDAAYLLDRYMGGTQFQLKEAHAISLLDQAKVPLTTDNIRNTMKAIDEGAVK
jgi:hypothetical protein